MSEKLLITVDEFENLSRKDLCKKALHILNKHYKGYVWAARAAGPQTIGITEAKFLQWGGDVQTYFIHDKSWTNQLEFEALVKKFGGELLERARQSRNKNDGVPINRLPEGFNPRFAPAARQMVTRNLPVVGPNGESLAQMKANIEKKYGSLITPTGK